MKYICDVANEPIEEGKHVEITIQPKDSNGNIDFDNDRQDMKQTFAVTEEIAKTLIEWIKKDTLWNAFNVFEEKKSEPIVFSHNDLLKINERIQKGFDNGEFLVEENS
jgi:hypothetical protein